MLTPESLLPDRNLCLFNTGTNLAPFLSLPGQVAIEKALVEL